jgi:3-octaprenyl-4-hydroxybenzoate carboxy-lyase
MFERVGNQTIPVVGNLLNSRERMARALGVARNELHDFCLAALRNPIPPVIVGEAPVQAIEHRTDMHRGNLETGIDGTLHPLQVPGALKRGQKAAHALIAASGSTSISKAAHAGTYIEASTTKRPTIKQTTALVTSEAHGQPSAQDFSHRVCM